MPRCERLTDELSSRSTSVICAGQGRRLLIEVEAGEGRLILLELIAFDEGQPVTIEHEPDVYEEKAGVGASEQKFFSNSSRSPRR